MRDLCPGFESLAAIGFIVPANGIVVVVLTVAVVIFHRAVVPKLIAIPYSGVLEIAEVGTMTKQRTGFCGLTGKVVDLAARVVRFIHIAGPGIVGERKSEAIHVFVNFE